MLLLFHADVRLPDSILISGWSSYSGMLVSFLVGLGMTAILLSTQSLPPSAIMHCFVPTAMGRDLQRCGGDGGHVTKQ